MGNQQGKSLPPDIQARIDDLEKRIKDGKFSNNKQGEKDVEGLLDYWHKNYGGKTKRDSLPSAKELINQHFNCTNILEKDKCQARVDSGCMWEPLISGQNDDKYDPDDDDAKKQKKYKGLCLKASPMSKAEQTPRPPSAVLFQHSEARKKMPKRLGDLKFSYPGAKVGAQPKTRFDISDRKAEFYRKEARKLVVDPVQPKSGKITNFEKVRDSELEGGRKTRRKRRKRKSRRKKRKTKRTRRKRKTRKRRKR